MLELIFVRHGETDSNSSGKYCGWTDTELNEKGLKQASAAAEKLMHVNIDAIYSSPLKRAENTAKILSSERKCPLIFEDNLKEQNFGHWEDFTYTDIVSRFPEESIKWQEDWQNYSISGGESSLDVYNRVTVFLNELIDTYTEGRILIVTHLGCIRYMLSYLMGMKEDGFWRFKADNGSISRVVIDENKFAFLNTLNT